MILEAEGCAPIHHPTEQQVRDLIEDLLRTGPSFVHLTNDLGDYVQIAGSRPWGVVEHRTVQPLIHSRAYQFTPNSKYKDGTKLVTGAGDIILQHDEWFLLKDAADIVAAFLAERPFPPHVQWRSLNETLGI